MKEPHMQNHHSMNMPLSDDWKANVQPPYGVEKDLRKIGLNYPKQAEKVQEKGSSLLLQYQIAQTHHHYSFVLSQSNPDFDEKTDPILATLKKAKEGFDASMNLAQISEIVKHAETDAATHAYSQMLVKMDTGNAELKMLGKSEQWLRTVFAESDSVRAQILDMLVKRKSLIIVDEMHWRVDRKVLEIFERFGINLEEYMHAFPDTKEKGVNFETGTGNGECLDERSLLFKQPEFGMSKAIPFPLAPLVAKLIDFDRLEEAIGHALPANEREILCHFLYALLVIAPGQTQLNTFDYDMDARTILNTDPNSIIGLLQSKIWELPSLPFVPSIISRHEDGKTVYPIKIHAPKTPSFIAACEQIAGHFPDFLTTKDNILHLVPANPIGTKLGDFGDISKLADGQLRRILDSRGMVYKRKEDYIRLMIDVCRKLTPSGIMISDSIRDNDGWRYRLPEWMHIQEMLKIIDPTIQILVVIGPAFENEDKYQGSQGVPKAVIMTRSQKKIAHFRENPKSLLPADKRTGAAHRVVTLDELRSDKDFFAEIGEKDRILKKASDASLLDDSEHLPENTEQHPEVFSNFLVLN